MKQGDRLTGDEFEEWRPIMAGPEQAELIEGVVHRSSPSQAAYNALPHGLVIAWLGAYVVRSSRLYLGDHASVRLDANNVLRPDAVLLFADGSRARVDSDGRVAGVPELVVEIESTGASLDLYRKFQVYRRCGVREYLAWLINDRRFEWWALQEGVYSLASADESGVFASRVFPGLCLAVEALLRGDMAYVLAVLQARLNSWE